MWVCPACAHIPKDATARFCERCGQALVEPVAAPEAEDTDPTSAPQGTSGRTDGPAGIETLPSEFDTDLSLPNVATVTGDVQDFMQTSEMGVARPPPVDANGEPQSVPAVRLSDAQMRAVQSTPVDSAAWKDWEGIHPMPSRLRVSKRDYRLVAGLDVADPKSAGRFLFEVREAEVVVRESGEGRYPRGATVAGRGVRHQGGYVVLTLGGLTAGLPVVMVRQCLAIGVEVAEVTLGDDDEVVAEIRSHEVDGETVWRNRATVIEALDVQSGSLEIRVWDVGSNPGMTWFNVWFYQPIN